jgi:hypothetical protein
MKRSIEILVFVGLLGHFKAFASQRKANLVISFSRRKNKPSISLAGAEIRDPEDWPGSLHHQSVNDVQKDHTGLYPVVLFVDSYFVLRASLKSQQPACRP